jgi:hypothetical protein
VGVYTKLGILPGRIRLGHGPLALSFLRAHRQPVRMPDVPEGFG